MAPHEVIDQTSDLHTPANGNAHPAKEPAWLRARADMGQNAFPSCFDDPSDDFRSSVDGALQKLEKLRPPLPSKSVPGSEASGAHFGEHGPFWEETNDLRTEFPETGASLDTVMSDVASLYNGVNMTGHRAFQYNIVTSPNKASVIATVLANYASANYSMGFASWNTSRAEVEVGNMVASLIPGWETGKQGGLFTFGGSGCYLYAIKYAVTAVLEQKNPRRKGVSSKGRVITSRHGHFCNDISTDWLGLGMDVVKLVDTQPRTNKMCMVDLERKLVEAQEAGEPVYAVVCTMGTTDSMVFDPVSEVRALLDKYPNPEGYGRTLIYCDTVAGWAFLTFNRYDFEANPLQFSKLVIELLKTNLDEMAQMQHADAIALDFHKSGYSPVTTSMFLAKDGERFERLLSRAEGHILHHRTAYSPGSYSLEVSRSAAPALAAWSSLRYLGLSGFHTLTGGTLEMTAALREAVKVEDDLVCTADIGCGFLTTLRAYPRGVDAKRQWGREYTEDSEEGRKDIHKYNMLQKRIGDRLWELSTTGQSVNGKHAYLLNYSSNFCSTAYKMSDGTDGPSFYALKVFPMNVHMSLKDIPDIVDVIKAVRDQIVAEDNM